MSASEWAEGCEQLLQVAPHGEVVVEAGSRTDSFGFDAVYGPEAGGGHSALMYRECVAPLVESVFGGVNATVLAYGQTGAGKSYTMGTDLERCQQAMQQTQQQAAAGVVEAPSSQPQQEQQQQGGAESKLRVPGMPELVLPTSASAGDSTDQQQQQQVEVKEVECDSIFGSLEELPPDASPRHSRLWRPIVHEVIDDACARAKTLQAQGVEVEMVCSFLEVCGVGVDGWSVWGGVIG